MSASTERRRAADGGPGARHRHLPPGTDPGSDDALDPYYVWAELSSYAGFGAVNGVPPARVTVMFEWSTVASSRDDAKSLRKAIEKMSGSNLLNEVGQSPYATANISKSELPLLTAAVAAKIIVRFQLALIRREVEDAPGTGPILRPPTVVENVFKTLGVVDDGCCLAHQAYRDNGKSSFLFVWDQNAYAKVLPPWKRFALASYGEELDNKAIKAILRKYSQLGENPERELYSCIGRRDWGAPDRTHGAGVTHTVSGVSRHSTNPDDNAPLLADGLIFVQLPSGTVADTSGGSVGAHVMDGARYIVLRTQQLMKAAKAAAWQTTINLSLGSNAGPHDGSTITELALDNLVTSQPKGAVQLVLAAGNTAGESIHAWRTIRKGHSLPFYLMIPPGNHRESYVEIWLPSREPRDLDSLTVCVTPPDGQPTRPIGVGGIATFGDPKKPSACLIFARRVAQGLNGTMILLAIRSTASQCGSEWSASAPSGVWSISLETSSKKGIQVHAWVERNDVIIGFRLPQQAHFINDETKYVEDDYTLSSIANGSEVVVVGAYCIGDATIADYSADGPIRVTNRIRPDWYGPSDESNFRPGLQVQSFYSGTWARTSGTSIAAPHVVRWLVEGKQGKTLPVHFGAKRNTVQPQPKNPAGIPPYDPIP